MSATQVPQMAVRIVDSSGNVIESFSAAGTASTTEVLYSNAATVDGISGWTTNGTTTLTGGASTILTAASIRTIANVGSLPAGVTAVEYGDSRTHQSVLTVSSTLPSIAGGASLGLGKLLYTFPAGAIIVDSAYMSMAITQTEAHINADTPKVGLGTVIASGAVAVLNGTGTFMDIITEQTAANCTGTAKVKTANPTAGVPFVIEAAAAHTIHFNAAFAWAASGDSGALLAGTVVLNWRFMN